MVMDDLTRTTTPTSDQQPQQQPETDQSPASKSHHSHHDLPAMIVTRKGQGLTTEQIALEIGLHRSMNYRNNKENRTKNQLMQTLKRTLLPWEMMKWSVMMVAARV
jgi:hypothetical protein